MTKVEIVRINLHYFNNVKNIQSIRITITNIYVQYITEMGLVLNGSEKN